MDTEEYYAGLYPEPPEYEEKPNWDEYELELADIYHEEMMLEHEEFRDIKDYNSWRFKYGEN